MSMGLTLINAFAGIGSLWTLLCLIRLLRFIHLYSRPSSLPRYHYMVDGRAPWALVTGASDGIGGGIARELAHRGFNVVLHGRNATKLENLKRELVKDFLQRNFRVAVVDASMSGSTSTKQIDSLVESLKDVNLTVLVNNVGGVPPADPLYKTFEKHTPSEIDGILNLNARFAAQLTAAILPLLLRHNLPTLIMTICSISEIGGPYLTTYSGAKAFDKAWSIGLAREMKAEGRKVEVLAINLAVVTGTADRKEDATFMKPDARTFARATLSRVGCGKPIVFGYWVHGLQGAILDALPESVVATIFTNAMKREMRRDMKRA